MRDFVVIGKKSGDRGDRWRHAAWVAEDKFTICGWKIPDDFVVKPDREPGCANCRRILKETRKAESQLQPGETTMLTPAQLNPPVVERLTEPEIVAYDVYDNAVSGTRAVKGWNALKMQVTVQNVDPAPLGTHFDLLSALGRVERLTVDVSTGDTAAYAATEADRKLLHGCKTDLSAIWHEVTGWSGQLCWDRPANGGATAEPSQTEEPPPAETKHSESAPSDEKPEWEALERTDANFPAIMSRVQTRRWWYEKTFGTSPKDAWQAAVTDVAQSLTTPVPTDDMSAAGLNKWLAQHIPPKEAAAPPSQKTVGKTGKTVEQLTREWLAAHDTIPTDAVLAHFTGLTQEAFARVRRMLRDEGYAFAVNAAAMRYLVTRPKTPEELELERMEAEDAERERRKAALRARIAEQRK